MVYGCIGVLICFIDVLLSQWAPDGKMIIFGMANGEIHIFDSLGSFMVSAWMGANYCTSLIYF